MQRSALVEPKVVTLLAVARTCMLLEEMGLRAFVHRLALELLKCIRAYDGQNPGGGAQCGVVVDAEPPDDIVMPRTHRLERLRIQHGPMEASVLVRVAVRCGVADRYNTLAGFRSNVRAAGEAHEHESCVLLGHTLTAVR